LWHDPSINGVRRNIRNILHEYTNSVYMPVMSKEIRSHLTHFLKTEVAHGANP
jgi:hypothetical protein